MRRVLATGLLLTFCAAAVSAQNLDAIKKRRELMQTIGKASLANFKMIKDEAPFNLATVQAGLKTFQDELPKFKALFPDDSHVGGGTDASPEIWRSRAKFEGNIDKFVADAKTVASAIKDEATFKAEYPKVPANCGLCHERGGGGFAPRLGDSYKKLNQ